MRRILIAGFASLALALTGACAGDDADVDADLSADTDTGDEAESAREYCEFSAELDTRTEPPSDEDLDRIIEIAPEEIKDDVETLATAIKNDDQENEEAVAAGERLEAWEDENCEEDAGDAGNDSPAGGESGEGDGDGDGGQDTEGPSGGNDGEEGGNDGTGAEVEAEVDGGDETTTTM